MDDLISTNEAAERLGISRQRVLQLIEAGRLPATKFANVYMIRGEDLKQVEDRPQGRPPNAKPAETTTVGRTKTGKTTQTPSAPGVQTAKEVILKSEAKKKGGKR